MVSQTAVQFLSFEKKIKIQPNTKTIVLITSLIVILFYLL